MCGNGEDMANPTKLSIDFSTPSPTSNSERFGLSNGEQDQTPAEGDTDAATGLVLDRLPLQLELEAFPEQPVDIVINAGDIDVAQLGIALTVNGRQLRTGHATVQYRVSIPVRDLMVGSNRIELSRPPLMVQSLEVELRPASVQGQQASSDHQPLDFGKSTPTQD
jgi:hypothetical protein